MGNETRLWKWGVIVVLVALAILALYPPQEKLKPGIDLAGGSVLIYEIDTAGMTDQEKHGLAERVMNILKARVDPNSQFNLVWRPIGDNRLEIQMPRPPKGAKERRDRYEAALNQLRELNVSRTALEQALVLTGDARKSALEKLAHGVEGREALLEQAAHAWDAYLKVRDTGDVAEVVPAQSEYESVLSKVQETSLPVPRLTDVLGLSEQERKAEIEKLKKAYPAYAKAIDDVVVAYDAWVSKRGSLEDPADLKRLLRGAGVLEFRILAERDPSDPSMIAAQGNTGMSEAIAKYTSQLEKRGPRPKAGDRYMWFPIDNFVAFMQSDSMEQALARKDSGGVIVDQYAGKWYVLAHVDTGDQKYGLTQNSPKWSLKRAYPSRDPATNRPVVDFVLDPRGGVQFASVTGQNIGNELAIFLDGVATSHATIRSKIGQHGQISGGFTEQRVKEIVQKLEAGSLPARLKETPLQEKVTGPSLGLHNREMGMKAAIYGMSAVIIFMLAYYLVLGALADIAVILNLLFVLAIMALLEATFTLPGIAGLALTVGMAVDANVLINERIREERERGVALKKAVKLGYDKAFSTIVDSNLTTLITAIILGYVGSEEVKGFAMTLGFGIVISMFTALFVNRVMLMSLIEWGVVKSLPMLHLIRHVSIDWLAMKRFFWPLSMICVSGGLGYFVYVAATDKEAIYDIEFLGGTSVQVELADGVTMTTQEIRREITGIGEGSGPSAVQWLRDAAKYLREAKVEAVPDAVGEFTVTSDKLKPAEVDALLR
ncbi:MAG TPA: protein translocase subunit SecD, partial [Phycisphaerae bacterium]|nr:protein translocase subunit SecD [Phycisphaerae bacterium]